MPDILIDDDEDDWNVAGRSITNDLNLLNCNTDYFNKYNYINKFNINQHTHY